MEKRHETYSIGEEVLVTSLIYKKFKKRGTIESAVFHKNAATPPSYYFTIDKVRSKVNQAWITRPHSQRVNQ